MRIRWRAKFHQARTEHLRPRPQLRVDLETDGGEHCRFQIADFRLEAADFRELTIIATSSFASPRRGSTRFRGNSFASPINSSQRSVSSASSRTTPIFATNSAFERARHVAR